MTEPPIPDGDGTGSTRRLPVLEKESDDPGPPPPAEQDPGAGSGDEGPTGRFWSARRVPAGVVALLGLLLVGVFLYDIVAVRAGRTALGWRPELAHQLAVRHLDDIWVRIGAAVAALLGLWLLLLALTPGLRRLLPMRHGHPGVRAGLHRDAAAAALRDRAVEVPGVQDARVRLRRRRAKVRALAHFRELDDVRTELDGALDDAVRGLGLAHPPAVSVRVGRPGRKG
ncbi:DUF6286 domain-containing protein [Streptomyces sp. NPDC048182]|uniref:DUF6286 domain-containing protein n=1 Tax=unclassified Streptomyces TaxID=2593676 RepID=UPI0033BA0F3C